MTTPSTYGSDGKPLKPDHDKPPKPDHNPPGQDKPQPPDTEEPLTTTTVVVASGRSVYDETGTLNRPGATIEVSTEEADYLRAFGFVTLPTSASRESEAAVPRVKQRPSIRPKDGPRVEVKDAD